MLTVIAEIRTRPGQHHRQAVLDQFAKIVPTVLKEEGCHGYAPMVDCAAGVSFQSMAPDSIVMIEQWESIAHLEAHQLNPCHLLGLPGGGATHLSGLLQRFVPISSPVSAAPPGTGGYLLFVLFPRQGAFHRFFPAAVAEVTFGGFDPRAELALDYRFLLQLIQILPEADGQACQVSGTQRGNFTDFRALYAGAQDVGLELHQEIVGYRTAVDAQCVQTNT